MTVEVCVIEESCEICCVCSSSIVDRNILPLWLWKSWIFFFFFFESLDLLVIVVLLALQEYWGLYVIKCDVGIFTSVPYK